MVGENGSDFTNCLCDVIKEYKENNSLIDIHQVSELFVTYLIFNMFIYLKIYLQHFL